MRRRAGARIVLTGYGSLGDLLPLVALGVGLRQRGHQVVAATAEPFREHVERSGLRFHPVRPHVLPDAVSSAHASPEAATEALIRDVLFPGIAESYADLSAAARGADLFISHMLAFAAPLVVAKAELPWVSVVLQPLGFLSSHEPVISFSAAAESGLQELDAATSRSAWRSGRMQAHAWAEPVRRLRAELGLPPGSNPIYDDQHSPRLVLGLFSSLLSRRQPDWPPSARITGFVFDDRDLGALPAQLEAFLSEGEAPVVATLGSHTAYDTFGFHLHSVLAALMLGRRVVLLGEGASVHLDAICAHLPWLRAAVQAYDFVPYSLVFPRAAVVIHHGGIGSIAAALRAGKPMLLVPMGFDQPDNAWRAGRLGFARVVAAPCFTLERAALELWQLLSAPRYAAAAAAASATVRREDGLSAACNAVEEVLHRSRGRRSSRGHSDADSRTTPQ